MEKNKTITYPNLLGIASVRGGSSWLHNILKSHPQIETPKFRKEIQYFTKYYNKSEAWYLKYFKSFSYSNTKYIAEFTPGYLSNSNAAERIYNFGKIEKFILILRNPIKRTFSQYLWNLNNNPKKADNTSFEKFYKTKHHIAIENSLYFKHFKRYLELFDRDKFLILIFEECISDHESMKKKLSEFLNIDADKFVIKKKLNESFRPKNKFVFTKLRQLNTILRNLGFNFFSDFMINKLKFKSLFHSGQKKLDFSTVSIKDKIFLSKIFKNDIRSLEDYLGRKINSWKIYE